MSAIFDAAYYLSQYQDVELAIVKGEFGAGFNTDLDGDGDVDNFDLAQYHYSSYGWAERRDPNSTFDTSVYLDNNPDVRAAGMDPLMHYQNFGLAEGRAPNGSIPDLGSFAWQAYVDAYPDLGQAGIDTASEAYAHYVLYGQFEGRTAVTTGGSEIEPLRNDGTPVFTGGDPGDPGGAEGQTYALTSGTDNLTGTANRDTFSAPIAQNQFAGGVSNTLSSADRIDGGEGADTLRAEIVNEFVGVTGNNTIDIQPNVRDVETITFEARELGFEDANTHIVVDAKKIVGHVDIGSLYSDSDLTIENITTLSDAGEIRNVSDLTITMAYTDNFNTDNDASDLEVLFDEDYLNRGQTALATRANYWLLDEDSTDYVNAPLLNIERNGVTLTIDGAPIELQIAEFAADVPDTWQGYATALQAVINQRLADGETILDGLTVVVDDTNVETTFNDAGEEVVIPAISVIDAQGRLLEPTGFLFPEDESGNFDIFGRYNNDPPESTDDPIRINVDLEKVGRDGEGGNLTIGGKNNDAFGDTDVDQSDGIEIFDINVIGDSTKPSNLGQIVSTNGALTTVNISTDAGETGTNGYAALTVRGEGTTSDTPARPFGGTLEIINAAAFLGDLTIGNVTPALDVNTLLATGGGNIWFAGDILTGGVYSYTTGSGTDAVIVDVDGDAVDTIGESLTVTTGAEADRVTITMDNPFDAPNVSFETMEELHGRHYGDDPNTFPDGQHWGETTYLDIVTDGGEDTVTIDAYGTFDISTGADSDFVHIDSTDENGDATMGAWTVGNPTGPQDFGALGFFPHHGTLSGRVLYQATLTVSFAGFEETVRINTDAAGLFVATQLDINDAIIEAIANNPELSRLLTVTPSTGTQQLVITSTVGGDNNLGIAIYQPDLVETSADIVEDGQVVFPSGNLAAFRQGVLATTDEYDSDDFADVATAVATLGDASYDGSAGTFHGALNQNGVGNGERYSIFTDLARTAEGGGIDGFDDDSDNNTRENADIFDAIDNYLDFGEGAVGTNATTGINFSRIDLGDGANDLVVLHSDLASANVIEITQVFGKVSVVNFHDVSPDEVDEVGDISMHALDFTTYLNNQIDESQGNGNQDSANPIAITVNVVGGAETFAPQSAGTVNLNEARANSINIIRFGSDDDDGETFAGLNANNLLSALNDGGSNYGNLTDALLDAADFDPTDFRDLTDGTLFAAGDDLVGTTQKHIVMVENGQNEGEFKVFYLTSTINATSGVVTDGDFNSDALLLGTLDFGASVNLNAAGSLSFESYLTQIQDAIDGGIATFQYDSNGDGTIDGTDEPAQFTPTLDLTGPVIPGDPMLSVIDTMVAVDEGDTGSTDGMITVGLSEARDVDTTFTVNTADGTATAGEDYTAISAQTFTITAGTASVEVPVSVLGDTVDEDDETFTVTISDPSTGVVLGASTSTVTITDDDGVVDPGEGTEQSLDSLGGSITEPATFDAGTDGFMFTDTVATASVTEISNFGADDSFVFTGVTADDVSVAVADGNTTFEFDDGAGNISNISLIGVSGFYTNVGEFNADTNYGDITFA